MPAIVVHAVEGPSPAQKKAPMRKIADAAVESFEVPRDRVAVRIVESDPDDKSRGGVSYSER